MPDLQIDKNMDTLKIELQSLFASSVGPKGIVDVINDITTGVRKGQHPRLELLEVMELRLKNNNRSGLYTAGLAELVESLKQSDDVIVSIYSIQNEVYAFAIYTNEACSKLFGVV